MKLVVRLIVGLILGLALGTSIRYSRTANAEPQHPDLPAAPVLQAPCVCDFNAGVCIRHPSLGDKSCADFALEIMRYCQPGAYDPDCFAVSFACFMQDPCGGGPSTEARR